MEHIIFDTTKNHILALGRAGEHNARKVTFTGFERESADHIVYVMVGAPIERMIPLSTDLSFMVQINITKDKATLPMELLEVDANGDLVKKSKMFNGVVETALEPTEEIEVTDPSLDLLYTELYQTYVEIKTAYESGAFKGEPGEPGEPGAPGAPGTDGISPTVSVEDIPNGHKVTITDKDGTRAFEVMNGEDGKDAEPYDDTEIRSEISQLSESITDIEGEVAEKITLADIPTAKDSTVGSSFGLGLVKGNGDRGTHIADDGTVSIVKASNAEIDDRRYIYRPIVPNNLVYAVDSVITSKATNEQLTDEQKATARERIGAEGTEYELVVTGTSEEDVSTLSLAVDFSKYTKFWVHFFTNNEASTATIYRVMIKTKDGASYGLTYDSFASNVFGHIDLDVYKKIPRDGYGTNKFGGEYYISTASNTTPNWGLGRGYNRGTLYGFYKDAINATWEDLTHIELKALSNNVKAGTGYEIWGVRK